MFLKHPCHTDCSQTAKLFQRAGTTLSAMCTHACAAYLLVVSCLPKRELRSKKGRKKERIKEMKERKERKERKGKQERIKIPFLH